jgi:hypothetical protein
MSEVLEGESEEGPKAVRQSDMNSSYRKASVNKKKSYDTQKNKSMLPEMFIN